MSALSSEDICRVLQPLFDLGAVRDWNGPAQRRLADLILPHTASDLRVSELLSLMEQVGQEVNGAAP